MAEKDFKKEVLITILDKGILAILLVIIGFFINVKLAEIDNKNKTELAHMTDANDNMLAEYRAKQERTLQYFNQAHEDQLSRLKIITDQQLESQKADYSFQNSVDEIRAQKLGEVWEAVYSLDVQSERDLKELLNYLYVFDNNIGTAYQYPLLELHTQYLDKYLSYIEVNAIKMNIDSVMSLQEDKFNAKLHLLESKLDSLITSTILIYHQNRFWLGENAFKQIDDFVQLIRNQRSYIESGKYAEANRIFNDKELHRKYINEYRDQIIK